MTQENENPSLKAALEYHRRGWCVIPIPQGKKVARVRWKRYQTERPDEGQLRKWLGDNHSNIAVVLGEVSGGLACRDFDTEQGYENWVKQHPDLAGKLPTVKTARGYHVYFLADVGSVRHFDDGELRGKGGYCLLPPSVHPDGVIYEWLIEPNCRNLLPLDPASAGLLQNSFDVTEQTEHTEKTQENSGHRGGEGKENARASDFEQIITLTLPNKQGTRNRKVFALARALRSLSGYWDAPPKFFEPVVREWHKRALPNIQTKEFEETWIDFLKAWPKIRWKVGDSPMSEVFEKVKTMAVPEFALRYENPKLRLLVVVCKLLQERTGKGSFFLSARTAGGYLDIRPMTASRWFYLLEEDKVVEVVEKGKMTRSGGVATRFRYISQEKSLNNRNFPLDERQAQV